VRRIIQISTASSGFFVLCDDGTVWGLTANHPGWMRLPDIPQDPVPEERETAVLSLGVEKTLRQIRKSYSQLSKDRSTNCWMPGLRQSPHHYGCKD